MILTINSNLFDDVPTNGSDTTIIIPHGCNAQGRMRSGFAKVVRDLNEGVYETYIKSGYKLGTVSYFELYPNVFIANCITQQNFGYDGKKYTSYDAVDECFKSINDLVKTFSLAPNEKVKLMFPAIGAKLGGGNLEIINKIIDVQIEDQFVTKIQYIL